MTSAKHFASVTAVLPAQTSGKVVDALIAQQGASALMWRARGTVLQDRWWQRWVPPISPAKTMLQMIVPQHAVDGVMNTVVTAGRLHQQATGAVFSSHCDNAYFGSEYHHWPEAVADCEETPAVGTGGELGIIYCIVSHERSHRVSRAAINAGAHGPIVHYSEGRGLRDRLGWLRITKEPEQEVLIVVVDRSRIESVFEAMAAAGEFHLPGRGLMYHMPIEKGMVNLPSRMSDQFYGANMQQVIRAIDHLSGHAHWRDNGEQGMGTQDTPASRVRQMSHHPALCDQVRLTAMVRDEDADAFSDLMLDAGVPGLTVCPTFFTAAQEGCKVAGARVNSEYALYRSILDPTTAARVGQVINECAEDNGLRDLCVFANPVPRVARYVAGSVDYRAAPIAPGVRNEVPQTGNTAA